MNQITAYQTTDGKLFSSSTDATKHQQYLAMKPEIDLFIKSSYCKYNNCAHSKIVENTILAWKAWCEK
tara:strand:- start:627 stop:830 length:204 start_codon:yes stop_codon:yes gene_type:complete